MMTMLQNHRMRCFCKMMTGKKEKKHTLISRILGFVAMGLSLIGMLTLFAPLFEVTILSKVKIGLRNIFEIKDLMDYFGVDSKGINWLIALIFVGLGFAFVSAILDIFANKPCKIVSTIFKGLAFAVPVTFIIFLRAEKSEVSAGSRFVGKRCAAAYRFCFGINRSNYVA